MSCSRFDVTHATARARRGVLTTPHGVVQTPAFMPVGTRGAVKAITHRDLEDARRRDHPRQHLSSLPAAGRRPDRAAGGLHAFIGWPQPILTDSGGYQVFSLAARRTDHRRRRRVPVASRRLAAPADAGERRRHPGPARLRHRDGARRVPRDPGDARGRRGARDGAVGALGAARARRGSLQLRDDPRSRRTSPSPTRGRRSSASSRAAIVSGSADRERRRRPSRSASRPTRSAG